MLTGLENLIRTQPTAQLRGRPVELAPEFPQITRHMRLGSRRFGEKDRCRRGKRPTPFATSGCGCSRPEMARRSSFCTAPAASSGGCRSLTSWPDATPSWCRTIPGSAAQITRRSSATSATSPCTISIFSTISPVRPAARKSTWSASRWAGGSRPSLPPAIALT